MPGGFLSEYDEVSTLTFGDQEQWWIKVRRFLSRGDFKKAQAALVTPVMRSDGETSETSGALDSGGYQNELAVAGVIDWNLTDRSGAPLPLEPEDAKRASLEQLPEKVFEQILLKIDGATAATTKAEAKKEEAKVAAFPGPGFEGVVVEAGSDPAEGAALVSA